jgi:alpha-D-ribose 1-methylphosphonate 5-triphosphate synthase subunit PhnH
MSVRPTHTLAPGFADPVFGSQSAFRSAMEALASPGRTRPAGGEMAEDVPLMASAAAMVLALCDFETPLYLSPHVAGLPGVAEFLRFHSGALFVREPSRAAFAVVDLRHDTLDLASFAQGTPDYPDRSTTVIACCASVDNGPAMAITGPGIAEVSALRVSGLPPAFEEQWAANRAVFPLGVDIIFAAPARIVALPRSTRIIGEAR